MRLDVYLTEKGLAKSRSYAAELIKKGLVTADGKTVKKPSFDVTGENVQITGELYPFVGRGGVKLEGALDAFGIDVSGMCAIDVGASTGGFTDCLLRRGAKKVYAVDSGHGQLHESLLKDERVVNMEGFNARDISPETIKEKCQIAVCDLSFISQTYITENVFSVLCDGGAFVTLIKPQFECGREALSKGGIVKDKKYHAAALKKVSRHAEKCGFALLSVIKSPILGGDGNTEFLAFFKKGDGDAVSDKYIEEVVG